MYCSRDLCVFQLCANVFVPVHASFVRLMCVFWFNYLFVNSFFRLMGILNYIILNLCNSKFISLSEKKGASYSKYIQSKLLYKISKLEFFSKSRKQKRFKDDESLHSHHGRRGHRICNSGSKKQKSKLQPYNIQF